MDWSPAQHLLAYWLRYYNNFYELCSQQTTVVDAEVVKPEWAEYDIIVDAFFVWFEKKAREKWRKEGRHKDDANPPRADMHPFQFGPAH